ncbi:hypothetical protein GCM10018952_30020 [Streptosporangium vulgare]
MTSAHDRAAARPRSGGSPPPSGNRRRWSGDDLEDYLGTNRTGTGAPGFPASHTARDPWADA